MCAEWVFKKQVTFFGVGVSGKSASASDRPDVALQEIRNLPQKWKNTHSAGLPKKTAFFG